MEEYSQMLLLFYRKVATQHTQKNTLIRKLHSLIKKCQLVEHDIDPHALKPKIKRDIEHNSPSKRA